MTTRKNEERRLPLPLIKINIILANDYPLQAAPPLSCACSPVHKHASQPASQPVSQPSRPPAR